MCSPISSPAAAVVSSNPQQTAVTAQRLAVYSCACRASDPSTRRACALTLICSIQHTYLRGTPCLHTYLPLTYSIHTSSLRSTLISRCEVSPIPSGAAGHICSSLVSSPSPSTDPDTSLPPPPPSIQPTFPVEPFPTLFRA